jgi:hypothetical protein
LVLCLILTTTKKVAQGTSKVISKSLQFILSWANKFLQSLAKICKYIPILSLLCAILGPALAMLLDALSYIINKIDEFVEYFIEFIFWVVGWIFWIIGMAVRWIKLYNCSMNPHPPTVHLTFNVKILADSFGNLSAPIPTVEKKVIEAANILEQCNIILVPKYEVVTVSDSLFNREHEKGAGTIFDYSFSYFNKNADCNITMYVVKRVKNGAGIAIPNTTWLIHDMGYDNCIVHEIGHLCDILPHSTVPGNIMNVNCGNQIGKGQCCWIRTSRFL